MNERLVAISCTDGEVGVTLGAKYRYLQAPPVPSTLVFIEASPSVDDAGLDIDVNITSPSDAVLVIQCAVKVTPGTWNTTHFGGTNAPLKVDANSIISLDANDAAANTTVHVVMWFLVGG